MDIIAVDAGGTWIKAARLTENLEVVDEEKMPSGAREGREEYFDSIADTVGQFKNVGSETAIGLAIPGVVNADRQTIRYTGNVAGLTPRDPSVTISDALAKRLGTSKLVADNDAGCAALAEWALGAGQADQATTLLHVTWGTGIGTGFVRNGTSQPGWEGGHLPLAWGAERTESAESCNCGSRVDLEAFVGVPRLIARAHRFWRERVYPTQLTAASFANERETSIVLLKQAETGDELANHIIDEALTWFARGLHAMAVLTYPDVVTIGGAMMSREWLLQRLQAAVAVVGESGSYLPDSLPPEKIQLGQLGNTAGMLGAGVIALQAFKE